MYPIDSNICLNIYKARRSWGWLPIDGNSSIESYKKIFRRNLKNINNLEIIKHVFHVEIFILIISKRTCETYRIG